MELVRALWRPVRLATAAALLSLGLIWLPAPGAISQAYAASYAKPSGLAATVSAKSVALRWKAVKNAPAYRVQFSTKSNMSTFTTMDVVKNYLEWTNLSSDPSAKSARLRPNTNYYFRVKVISLAKANLTSYSKTLKVKTASTKAMPELPPVSLKSTKQSATSMYLSWASRGPGVSYRIRYGTSSGLATSKSKAVTSTTSSAILSGLKPNTRYYYKVRVLSATGTSISNYSATAHLNTPTSYNSPQIKVATYNVCSDAGPCAGTWAAREPAVVANLATHAPDVFALQEITRDKVSAVVTDLNAATGRTFATSDSTKVSSGTTRLIYDTGRFSLAANEHGAVALPLGTSDTQKYAVWAILTDRTSGKRFFVVGTHLMFSTEYVELRRTQAQTVIELINQKNVGKLPVVIAGDLNSARSDSNPNVPYDVFTSAGYREPLGNTYHSWAVANTATAEHRVDLQFSTFNKFETYARRSKYSNGNDLDYLWNSPTIRVAVCQVVVNLNSAGNFIGVIPSDHNLLIATIHLP